MPTEKILIDTNLLVYSIDEDSIFYSRTIEFFRRKESEFYTTSKNISEFISVVTQKNVYSLSVEQSLKAVIEFENNFKILFPDGTSFSIFKDIILKYKPKGNIIHDYEIASIAISNSIKKIATVNVIDFSHIKEIEVIEI